MGKIIVRTGRDAFSRAPIGKIYETLSISSYCSTAVLNGGWGIESKHYRMARKNEIRAFKKGCRNIKDLHKYTNSGNYKIC